MGIAHPYVLRDALESTKPVLTAWSSVPDTGFVSTVARQPFDCVTLDMQHGGHDERSVYDGVDAVVALHKSCVVRIPVGRFDMASRALDFGADAVIAPMVNSVDDAKAFAAAVKYPPVGGRSWGPSRALSIRGLEGGDAHLHNANRATVSFAMIETREAMTALDDILAVDGIDGVFVGPADFSIAWSNGESVDPRRDDMMDTIAEIAQRATAVGKYAGIFAVVPSDAPKFHAMGYGLIAIGFDTAVVAAGARAVLSAANGS
ncbi:MAG: aldolase/citrate lyase family protein [Pseudomonadota bacterium]